MVENTCKKITPIPYRCTNKVIHPNISCFNQRLIASELLWFFKNFGYQKETLEPRIHYAVNFPATMSGPRHCLMRFKYFICYLIRYVMFVVWLTLQCLVLFDFESSVSLRTWTFAKTRRWTATLACLELTSTLSSGIRTTSSSTATCLTTPPQDKLSPCPASLWT